MEEKFSDLWLVFATNFQRKEFVKGKFRLTKIGMFSRMWRKQDFEYYKDWEVVERKKED